MFDRHASRRLAAYLDGALTLAQSRQVETHAAVCERCRAELDLVRDGMALVAALPEAHAPESVWAAIESAFERREHHPAAFPWRFAAAFATLVIVAAAVLWTGGGAPGESWQVQRLAGTPTIGSQRLIAPSFISSGEAIVTDAVSRARIQVGAIGSVDVEPNTDLAIIAARPAEHRLALRSGQIAARIVAPPRLFFVETASGTAVDLGCEYTLRCDRAGAGVLRVQTGWVAYEFEGRESLVPAGATCRTRPGIGPGTPYFEDAPPRLVEALDAWDTLVAPRTPAGPNSPDPAGGTQAAAQEAAQRALSIILAESRVRDTLTLWHLLSQTDAAGRVRVFERMTELSPLPEVISREKVLALDPETLTLWRQELAWTW